tara:strand:- start:2932 stop:3180 length:249 start_codon:yes stop_codon:yes gene_type:complete
LKSLDKKINARKNNIIKKIDKNNTDAFKEFISFADVLSLLITINLYFFKIFIIDFMRTLHIKINYNNIKIKAKIEENILINF